MAESHPVQSGSGTQAGQEGDAAPGSSRLHGRQEGPGGHPPPDPWGRVTSPRGERSPQDCSSWVRGQEPFLIAYFQSWQSQPDPNMSNGLPHWLPPQMAHPLSCSVVPWTPRPEGASVPQLTAHQAGIAQYRDPTPSAHPMTGCSPPDLTAGSFQEKPTASCNTEGKRDTPVPVDSTHLALPGHAEGQEPFP